MIGFWRICRFLSSALIERYKRHLWVYIIKINSKLQDGNIPLFAAVEAGNIHVCRELLLQETEAQLKYTKPPLKDLVLHLAARKRDNDMVKLFIEAGAVVDGTNVRIAFIANIFVESATKWQWPRSVSVFQFPNDVPACHFWKSRYHRGLFSTFSSQSRLFCFLLDLWLTY